jgi:hypothetical protein
MTDSSGVHEGSPVAVILHERRGSWARQLRPRLQGLPVRWFETRSAADLAGAIDGLAAPVVVIDLGKDPAGPLEDLVGLVARDSSARVLVIDAEARDGVKALARELGATHVVSGFAAPPEVAELIARWVMLAAVEIERAGWSRPLPVDPAKHPMEWIEGLIAEAGNAPGPTPPDEPPPADS